MFPILRKLWNKFQLLRSVRLKLIVLMVFVGLVPVSCLCIVLTQTYHSQAISQRVDELTSYGNIISNYVLINAYLETHDSVEVDNEVEQIADVYQGRIIIVDENLRVLKDSYGLEENKTIISTDVIQCLRGKGNQYVNDIGDYVQVTLPITDSSKNNVGVILLSFSTKTIDDVYSAVAGRVFAILAAIVVLVIVFACLFSVVITNPLKTLTTSIDFVTQGHLDETITAKGYPEVENIAESCNRLITMLQNLDDTRQEFVSNVSHELKTPLASMKVLSESLLSQSGQPEELYREFLVDINDEVERMTGIINDLLFLVKMDKSSGEMVVTKISINELLESILKRLRPIAAQRNIELVYESFRPVMADVDEVKLSIALNNLIDNAIKYNYDDGWVRVSLNADHKFFYVKVVDSGVGIPEDVQDHVFERFYRVDKARSRETGGTGLGLALTRNAVLMHKGAIKLYSKEKEGTTFTVRIPLTYIPN